MEKPKERIFLTPMRDNYACDHRRYINGRFQCSKEMEINLCNGDINRRHSLCPLVEVVRIEDTNKWVEK